MEQNWELKTTSNINQMLRVRTDITIDEASSKLPNLLVIKHQYHIADDIMFPDPSCLAFFTAFEQNHLSALESQGTLSLMAVDIFEGTYSFFIYCDDAQKSVYDCISFLKSNELYKCDFEIVMNEKTERLKSLIS